MGKTLLGGSSYKGKQQLLTQEQQSFLGGSLSGQGPAGEAYQQLIQPQQHDYSDLFQQSFIDPAMQTYQQQVVPSIQQRFVDAGAGSSSALNQALAESASNLSTQLGGQMGNFTQNQQQMAQQGQLAALGQMGSLASQKTFEPIYEQKQGILPMAIEGAGAISNFMPAGQMSKMAGSFKNMFSSQKQPQQRQYSGLSPYQGAVSGKYGMPTFMGY